MFTTFDYIVCASFGINVKSFIEEKPTVRLEAIFFQNADCVDNKLATRSDRMNICASYIHHILLHTTRF